MPTTGAQLKASSAGTDGGMKKANVVERLRSTPSQQTGEAQQLGLNLRFVIELKLHRGMYWDQDLGRHSRGHEPAEGPPAPGERCNEDADEDDDEDGDVVRQLV